MYGLRTMILVVLMAGLLMVVGLAVAGQIGLIVMGVVALGINIYSYWNSHSMVPKLMGGQLVTAKEQPALYRIVEQAACQAKMPFKTELLSQFTEEHLEARCTGHCRPGDCPRHVPSVYVIETPIPNAFATGRSPTHSAVAATTGIMRATGGRLTDRELAAVMAHELAHITNRDTLWSTIVASMAMVISFVAMIAQWGLMFAFLFGGMGGRDSNGGGAGHLAGALIVAIIAPIMAAIIQSAVSRQRELKADDTGARRCGDPQALASALQKLEQGVRTPEARYAAEEMKTAEAANHLFIVNPLAGGPGRWFSTHPPTEQRVEQLRKIGEDIGRPF